MSRLEPQAGVVQFVSSCRCRNALERLRCYGTNGNAWTDTEWMLMVGSLVQEFAHESVEQAAEEPTAVLVKSEAVDRASSDHSVSGDSP